MTDHARHHSHQCGLTALGILAGYGCGHVWNHPDATQYTLSEHYCPQCGKGPFTMRMSGTGAENKPEELKS